MNIKGSYIIKIPIVSMFMNTELKIPGENIITRFGESFFMNRCLNDYFSPISYIGLGDGTAFPRKTDSALGHETSRQRCSTLADLESNQIILTSRFPAREVIGTSEIGVLNDEILISHDSYPKISEEDLPGLIGDVTIDYTFQFNNGAAKTGWQKAVDGNYIYYVPEENIVKGVLEDNIHGYRRVNSIESLNQYNASYYYDETSKNLYIRTTDNSHPETKEIVVRV